MLENIKLVLDIKDTNKDGLLQYYINITTNTVLSYCNQIELNPALESVVAQIVIGKVKGKGEIKSKSIGDYSVTYNVAVDDLTPYIKILNKNKRAKIV